MTAKAGSLGVAIDGAHLIGVAAPNATEWSGVPGFSVQTVFAITAGALPPGVSIAQKAAGTGTTNQFGWKGVPTAVGVYTADVGASGGYPGDTFTWTIALVGGCPLIEIDPDVLDDVFVGESIAIQFTATNGVAPFTWDVAEWTALPDGLALSSGGLLSGVPTTPGDYTFTIRATDANGCPGVVAIALSVLTPDPIVVAPATLDAGDRGELYATLVTATGGIGTPYTFAITAGALPPGLALSSAGVLAGLPTRAGAYTFTIRATDAATPAGNTGDRAYTLVIAGLRIVIDGIDRTVDIADAEIELALNRQATATIEIGDADIPARGADVLIYARDGITPIFGGLALVRRVGGMGASHPANKIVVDLVDYSSYFEDADAITIDSAVTQDLEDVIAAIVAQSLSVYGITYTPTATGKTVPPIAWIGITVTDAFKRITDATGVVLRVLPLKALDVFSPLDDAAPVSITDATINAFDLQWQDPPNLPRNTVDLLCGPAGNGLATQTWEVDSGEISWEVDIQAVLGTAQPARRANAYLSPVGATNFSAGDTIGVGSSTYTFRAALVGDVAGEVLIGATVEDSLANLNAAINLAGGGVYAPSTPANADCSSYLRDVDQLEADALVAGAAGNAIAVTSSNAPVAFWYGEGGIARGTLQLGADASGVAGWTWGYILEDGAVARPLSGPGDGGWYEWDVTAGRGTVSLGTGTRPPDGTILELQYLAVFPFHARVSSGSPPITFREDHPEIVVYADGIALATELLARESADRRELEVSTDVDGFLPGQALTVDTTYRGVIDAVFLVSIVRIKLINADLWEYSITTQQTTQYAGSFVEQWKALTSGGSSGAASATITDGGAAAAGDVYTDGRNAFRADQSMGGHRLRSVADPTADQDAATKAYVDSAAPSGAILADGSVDFTGDQSLGGFNLIDVADPANAQDAATKAYVDALIAAGAWQVAAATVATGETQASGTAYGDLATAGPAVTIDLVGTVAIIWLSAQASRVGTGFNGYVSVDVSGASTVAASDANSTSAAAAVSGGGLTLARVLILTGLTPGSNTFTAKYHNDGGSTWTFSKRGIAVAYQGKSGAAYGRQFRLPFGGDLDAFRDDTTFVDLPGSYEFEIDGDDLAASTVHLEINAMVEVTAAATASFKAQYWNGAAWADIAGATAAVAMTTAGTRYWATGAAFTPPAGRKRVKILYKGDVGAAAMVSGAAWLVGVPA